jgi:hypothetical protein
MDCRVQDFGGYENVARRLESGFLTLRRTRSILPISVDVSNF